MPAFYPEGDEPKLADPSGRSLHKINNLLKSIDAKTGSTTITGPVTVSNEVEVTNSTGNPIPVSGTVALDSNSLAALENISVTFPATQNVNVTNAGLSVSVSNLPATQPVSLASAPVTPVTDNGGSLTVDGTVTVNDMTSGNAKTKIVDSVGADVSYITAGTAGTPSAGVLSVQGINGGVSLPISGTVTANGGDFTAQNGNTFPDRSVQIGFFDTYATGDFVRVNNDGREFPVKAYGVSSVGNSNVIPVAVGNEGNKPITGVPIAWSDDDAPDTRIAGTTYPLPIQAPNGIAISGTVTAVDLGAKADAVASTDTGTFSVIAFIKRGLQNWTTLLAKIPALVSGRIPVDGSGVTQPVSGTITAAQATAANLNATVVQGTATNLRTAAEVYTGGNPVSASNALTIKTTNAYGSNSPVVSVGYYQSGANGVLQVSDGSGLPVRPSTSATFAVTGTFWQATQPVSLASAPVTPVTDNGGSLTVDGTVTATQSTASSLKAQAQILNSAGSLVTYAETGTYGSPSVDVISVQNPQGTTATITTFTSTTASTSLIAAGSTRKALTVYNSGAGDLYISPTALCTTTNFQIRLSSGDYWECPESQVLLSHTAVFASAGTAYITSLT